MRKPNKVFLFIVTLLFATSAMAEELSGPFQHENLSVYLIHGEDSLKNIEVISLDQALREKIAIVEETGSVNELQVFNRSKKKYVFVDSGDIVKGGKQDSTMGRNLLIPPQKNAKVPAFCVESGRWRKRGKESSRQFRASGKKATGRRTKLAIRSRKEQGKVWSEIDKLQNNLAGNGVAGAKDSRSATSLQLTLENKNLARSLKEYKKKLSSIAKGKSNVIGVVYAIGAELQGAEFYGSNALFNMQWPSLLETMATESIGQKKKKGVAPSIAAAKSFALGNGNRAEIDSYDFDHFQTRYESADASSSETNVKVGGKSRKVKRSVTKKRADDESSTKKSNRRPARRRR